ncbi:hypothetical protein IJG72_02995 [bacterium]|nr:hypothetical protein [bacterium]
MKKYIDGVLASSGCKLPFSNGLYLIRNLKSAVLKCFSDFVFRIFDCFKNRNFLKKCFAFTLAEVLIVMGVVGVVAALTIPNLTNATKNAENVTKLKKIYSELNRAHERAIETYGPMDEWTGGDANASLRYFDRITEFMQLQKSCRNSWGCLGTYKNLYGGNHFTVNSYNYPKAILKSGCAIRVQIDNVNCTINYGYKSSCGFINVDLDGPRGRNITAIDYFSFVLTTKGIYPYGGGTNWNNSTITNCAYGGTACTEWVIRNSNMDYLNTYHTNDSNKGKCINNINIKLSTENSTCN